MIRLVPSGKKDGHGNKPDSGREVAPCVGFIPSIMNQRVNCCNQASLTMWIPVKHFLSVLTRALRGARHFALVEDVAFAIPTKARS